MWSAPCAWCISASPPTPSPPGRWRTRSATWRTNGEINTLRGNVNWMHARQSVLGLAALRRRHEKLFPVIQPGGSDSAAFDKRARAAGHVRPRHRPRHGHADSRSVVQKPPHEPAEAGLLRVPRLSNGALGRSRCHGFHRRPLHRRNPRPQRLASGPVPGHA